MRKVNPAVKFCLTCKKATRVPSYIYCPWCARKLAGVDAYNEYMTVKKIENYVKAIIPKKEKEPDFLGLEAEELTAEDIKINGVSLAEIIKGTKGE